MRLLITGTPGTGKTMLARKIARLLKAELVVVNDLVKAKRLYYPPKRGEKEKTVRLGLLQAELKKILKKEPNVVIDSHLLCEIKLPCDRIIVLRCDPRVLERRLKRRRYPIRKTKENALAETLDYCLVKAEENYPKAKILQADNTRFLSAKALLERRKPDAVRWMRLVNPARFV